MAKTPNEIDCSVGQRVRMRRMMLGISQKKLGETLNLPFQQVQKYEYGVNRIGASRLYQIAKALKVEPGYFFEDCAPVTRVDSDEETLGAVLRSREGIALARAFTAIPDANVRHLVVEICRSLANEASMFSGVEHTLDLPVTQAELAEARRQKREARHG